MKEIFDVWRKDKPYNPSLGSKYGKKYSMWASGARAAAWARVQGCSGGRACRGFDAVGPTGLAVRACRDGAMGARGLDVKRAGVPVGVLLVSGARVLFGIRVGRAVRT